MNYYHVWVRSMRYRGSDALTYSSARHDVSPGAVVRVPLGAAEVLGIVVKKVKKPAFATKPISEILSIPTLPKEVLELAIWMREFYPSPIGVITQLFLPKELSQKRISELPAYTQHTPSTVEQPPLTVDQDAALKQINQPDTYIIHGRTGSGKTRLYTELAAKSLKGGKSVMILSPEIGLTSQIAGSFKQLFGESVVVLHSQLTSKERESSWLKILHSKSPLIVIGPRSALFCPLSSIGLIVVDEAHDSAYKQEQALYYHAVRAASQLRHIHSGTLLLGSATPSVTDYYLAKEKNKRIIRLDQLAIISSSSHETEIVDLKDRNQFSSNATHISKPLINAIYKSLERKEQSLLYLNRRGTARVTLCDKCGWQALCPKCDLPLTYHGDNHMLRCHTCGFTQTPVLSCPVCGNTSVILKSVGTKAIVDEARRLFPEARIVRFDTDNVKADRLEQKYQSIINGEVDILVGTQMLAKGLDLPRLSTLGIILADSSLYLPDFSSQERTYQLMTQVLGRIGRGHINSKAFIQTYLPADPMLKAALLDDWDSFYKTEIDERLTYVFPPFCHLLKLTCRRSSASSAEKAAYHLKQLIAKLKLPVNVDGPAPAFHEKVAGKFEWQLVIKSKHRDELLKIIENLPSSGWNYDIDPVNLL